MISRVYKVAGHTFSVESNLPESAGVDLFALMDNYEPFAVQAGNGNASESPLFTLAVEHSTALPGFIEETRQEDEGQEILCGHSADGSSMFNFRLRGADVGMLLCSPGYVQARLVVPGISNQNSVKFAVNNSLMVLYALATAKLGRLFSTRQRSSIMGRAICSLARAVRAKARMHGFGCVTTRVRTCSTTTIPWCAFLRRNPRKGRPALWSMVPLGAGRPRVTRTRA